MAFKFKHVLRGDGLPAMKTFIIANSAAMVMGEAVGLDADGFLVRVAAGARLLGVVQGFASTVTGLPVDQTETATFTAASDNETVAKIGALVILDPEAIYSAPADATLGTTTGSDVPGALFDHPGAAYGTLDESTASTTYSGGGQFFSLGKDPGDTTRVLVRIHERLLS